MNALILALAALAQMPSSIEGRVVGWSIGPEGDRRAPILGVPNSYSDSTTLWEAYRARVATPDGRSIEWATIREGMFLRVHRRGFDDCWIEVWDDPQGRIDALIANAGDAWRRAPREAEEGLARLDRTLGARLFRVREKATWLIRRAGDAGVPMMVLAARSRDPEVRRRGAILLDEFRGLIVFHANDVEPSKDPDGFLPGHDRVFHANDVESP